MMAHPSQQFTPEEAAAAARMDIQLLLYYAEVGIITPSTEGYSDRDLIELRRIRRLREELELDRPAIEILLRLCRRIQTLQSEIRRLEMAARPTHLRISRTEWIEADWGDEEVDEKE